MKMAARALAAWAVLAVSTNALAEPAEAAPESAEEQAVPGVTIDNFHRMTPYLYRGARPQAPGVEELKKLGIDLVIDLQDTLIHVVRPEKFDEKAAVEAAGMQYLSKPINPVLGVKPDRIQNILDRIEEARTKGLKVYIHCLAGQDRTGFVAAFHRVKVEGWEPERAHAEWLRYGYHPHVFFALDTYFRAQVGIRPSLLNRTLGRLVDRKSFEKPPIVDPNKVARLRASPPHAPDAQLAHAALAPSKR
jgi:protein tyrosine/serine phosphatase